MVGLFLPKTATCITLSCLPFLELLVLTAVAFINEAIENEDSTQLIGKMSHENAGLTSVEESLCNRYLSHLMSVKEEKAQVGYGTFQLHVSKGKVPKGAKRMK